MHCPPFHSWSERWERRLDWAWAGLDTFADSLPDRHVRSMFRRDAGGKPLVVTFGSPQVGKTELLLRLLGYPATSHERIAEVLRAGRSKGQSSSATPMLFKVATEDGFRIDNGSEGRSALLDEVQAQARFQELRDDVEHGRMPPDRLVTVQMPLAPGMDLRQLDVGVAVDVGCGIGIGTEVVGVAEALQEVVGVGAGAHDHPGIAPDRHCDRAAEGGHRAGA